MFAAIKSFFTTVFYQPLYNLLFLFIAILPGHNLGLGIIALTLLVRFLLVPSSAQAVRAQRELQVLQPEIDRIRKEYKDQPEELNKRLLALYQEHNVNPFKSCLPVLVQLPILFILYRVFFYGIQSNDFSLLYSFVPAPTDLHTSLFGIDLTARSVSFDPFSVNTGIILALLAGAFQFIQTRQMMARQKPKTPTKSGDHKETTEVAQQVTGQMAYFMPLITIFFAASLPAALAIYWIVTTLFSIGQQWWIFRTKPAVAAPHVSVKIKE